jgi:predicted MPP superfamily phosphohydrolase
VNKAPLPSPFPRRNLSRRKFFGALSAGVLGAAAYMRWCEPDWFQVGRYRARIHPHLSPIRIAHMSDFHASADVPLPNIDKAITLAISLKPDLVCLTGDFITWKYDHFGQFGRLLKRLSDVAPAFACLGNHDGGRWSARHGYADHSKVESMLRDAGVILLHNASAALTLNQRRVRLVGVGDLWAGDVDAAKAFSATQQASNDTVLVLSHNPDSKSELSEYSWDLMLCGHTHGGQLWIPFLGAPFAPVRDRRFVKGLRRWNDRWIHVTRGVGSLHGMRLNCPPEVSLVTIA